MIIHGDCLRELKLMADNSVDSIVTDPPYGLSFMGKKWDYDVPSVEIWREALRVLKPGGHLLSFGGTRTYHRLVCNIEDAGFEIRDQIMWLYGSGFPKSTDVSKRIDKEAGAEREVVGINPSSRPNSKMKGSKGFDGDLESEESAGVQTITAPSTDEAKQWQGWGSALKPANEPIVVARKPLEKGLTLAANVLKYGTGALNIDASRIGFTSEADRKAAAVHNAGSSASGSLNWNAGDKQESSKEYRLQDGRWPANVLLDEEAAAALDEQSGTLVSKWGKQKTKHDGESSMFGLAVPDSVNKFAGDSGGASRFFYVAKASKRERGEGNAHPTVKPIKLMEYLIKLVTPSLGKVLDPFAGSGTTLIAAIKNDYAFIGIERESEYVQIIRARIKRISETLETQSTEISSEELEIEEA